MKKIVISLLFLLLTGCWNYKELNNYSIVTGIAIDKLQEEYEVSVLIANTPKNDTSNEANSSKMVVYSGRGKTIFSAIKDIGLISSKELYLGHFSILVISDKVAYEGISNVVDLFLRESSSKKNFYVAITRDCKAKDTLKIITPLSNISSQNLADNLSSTTKLQGIIANISFNELLSNIKRPGIENAINSIKIIGDVESGSNISNTENSEPNTYIKLDSLGIFNGDKLISWTDYEESIGINILRNKAKQAYVSIVIDNSFVTIDATEITPIIDIDLYDGLPKIDITIKGEAKLVEIQGDIDINSDKTINLINKKINEEVLKYIKKGINVALNNKSDVFGFGLMFYQKYPKYYKQNETNWISKLKSAKVNINCEIKLKTKGSSHSSLEDNND